MNSLLLFTGLLCLGCLVQAAAPRKFVLSEFDGVVLVILMNEFLWRNSCGGILVEEFLWRNSCGGILMNEF